jgi:nitrile hydratase subunit beta
MKLQHYIGGLEGLGAIDFETRVFVEPWETRIFGIHVAMMALSTHLDLPQTPSIFRTVWTWADLRAGAEAMNPLDYFKFRYYERWLGGVSSHFIANSYITEAELDARTEAFLSEPDAATPSSGDPTIDARVHRYLVEGASPKRDVPFTPLFAVGERVTIKNVPAADHTRLPGYLRGKTGIVEEVYDAPYAYLCDTGPDGIGAPMPVYRVRFDPQTLWDKKTETGFSIYADLFEHYLGDAVAEAA